MVLQKPLLLTALGFGLKTVPLLLICLSLRRSVYNNEVISTTR